MKNLIMAGWHYPEYLAAAAAMYGCTYRGKADVLGVSMGSLAATLDVQGRRYGHIDVLGVGLTENLEKLARVLEELSAEGVSVRWVSRQNMPEQARKALAQHGGTFSETVVMDRPTLLEVVAERFNCDKASLARLRPVAAADVGSIRELADTARCSECIVWAGLYQAAGFAHRYNHDETACGKVVEALWRGDPVKPLRPPLDRLMRDYQAGYSKELIGKSPVMVALRTRLDQAARYEDANVLLLGETGTGKELAAEYIHCNSSRSGKTFLHHNCAYGNGNGDMLMDRLFGHEKGAFTGATRMRPGLFEDANGGTLFLDEIGEASPAVQAMLLTVLDTGQFYRVGGTIDEAVRVNVRLVCATNRNLQQMVLDGRFRLDLYERISGFPVQLPPLRAYKEDLPLIVRHYWRQMTGRLPTERQLRDLMDYDYPGNTRELVSLLKQACALCPASSADPSRKNPDAADFKAILDHHRQFNSTLIEGIARQRGRDAVGEAGARAVSCAIDELPERKEDVLAMHASRMFLRYGRRVGAAAKAADMSENTFKKYLALARRKGWLPEGPDTE